MDITAMTEASKPPSGRRMKARAPPPPQAPQPVPRRISKNTVLDGGGKSGMDTKENMLRPTVDLQLTLPQGHQTSVTEDGSKALMDLLVELCSRYHLNPALHTLELLSPEGHPLVFKPNALLGSFNVAFVFIKEKVWEEKVVRRPAPKVPEKTVRLMVNYHGSQKAVVRVNPLAPLQALIPVICDKCEFEPSHVLLLKDSVSRHELPLDRSLTELGIKELYVFDQTNVLRPKMASTPALNYSDSICSSTASLGRVEKKGLLGIFSRRKSKTEKTSMDMDNSNDKVFRNTDTHSTGLSTEERLSTSGQSQSVMNVSRMSPMFDTKKRRAPVPPGALTSTMEHNSFEGYQMDLVSESQQRKRKAPAPPPTPASSIPGPDDTYYTTAASTPDSHATETSTPVFYTRVTKSTTVSDTNLTTQTVKPAPLRMAAQTPSVGTSTPNHSSPTPSSSTTDSLAIQDSSSDLSHSLEDSDLDPDQTISNCSTLSSSTVSVSVQGQAIKKRSSSRMEERDKASSMANKLNQESTSASISRSENESALNLKLDEVENSRHSAMAWLHSMHSSATKSQTPETETPAEETLSLDSSSGGSSLPDQGYGASEGMAEGDDSGLVSSPSDTQPTSPDGTLVLERSGRDKGKRPSGQARDNSSDSDEGCATWESRDSHKNIKPQARLGRVNDHYKEDPELTAQLHQTLEKFEADLSDTIDVVSEKRTSYISMDINEVPVSVVDLDVPVTAIDEVLEVYEANVPLYKPHLQTRTEPADSKVPNNAAELQNKNNNACTAANSHSRSSANKKASQPDKHRTSQEKKSKREKKERKMRETEVEVLTIPDTNIVKEDRQRTTSTVMSSVEAQKHGKNTQIKPDPLKGNGHSFHENKRVLPPSGQRLLSAEGDEIHRVYQQNSASKTSQSQITRNVTSRFGMKTFTVVPPKAAVLQDASGKEAATSTSDAIKIDDQGNIIKVGVRWNKASSSSEADIDCSKGAPLVGKAKAFWTSNETQENTVHHSKGLIDKANGTAKDLKSNHTAVPETLSTGNREDLRKTQSTLYNPAVRAQPKERVKEVKESVKDVNIAKEELVEVASKISVTKNQSQKTPHPLIQDMAFLKPSRRTSSQYVASAINKYNPMVSTKPNSMPYTPESASSKTQNIDFQRSGQSTQVNHWQSRQTSLSDNNPGPKRSMSSPDYGEVRDDRGGSGHFVGSTKGNFNVLEKSTLNTKHVKSISTSQVNVITTYGRDDITHIQGRSSNPSQSSPLQISAKPLIALKTVSQGQTSMTRDTTKAAVLLSPDEKPKHSLSMSDGSVVPPPPPVTVFGPVKKFKPVICRSVEKETSLHSNLMEAIMTGGGKDRLKKMSSSGASSMTKPSLAEEENERSALLAAIRAQSSSARLKKTKSDAADELGGFRKAASAEERSADLLSPPSRNTLALTSPHAYTPPPPAIMFVPPPPPPFLPPSRPTTVAHPSGNISTDPAFAREAMMEAIRSGSAADKLKKVTAPAKTVRVNGRLGTIKPSSSTLQ